MHDRNGDRTRSGMACSNLYAMAQAQGFVTNDISDYTEVKNQGKWIIYWENGHTNRNVYSEFRKI